MNDTHFHFIELSFVSSHYIFWGCMIFNKWGRMFPGTESIDREDRKNYWRVTYRRLGVLLGRQNLFVEIC